MIYINYAKEIKRLMEPVSGPCLSFYLPLKQGNENIQGQIILKNLLREAELQLSTNLRRPELESLLNPIDALLLDTRVWERQGSGLAVFQSPDFFSLLHSPNELESQVVVGDAFHVKPLLPLLNKSGDYYVLDLDLGGSRLFHGTEYSIDQIELPGTPLSLAEAMQYDDRERQLQFHTGTGSRTGASSRAAQYHGHGVGTDDEKTNILNYYKQLDSALQRLIGTSRTPVVLGGVEYLTAIFREASNYQFLQANIIAGSLSDTQLAELRDQAWQIVSPQYASRQAQAEHKYNELLGTGLASKTLNEIVPACCHGRVESLFVATDAQVWGDVDAVSNAVDIHDQPNAENHELLNLAAVEALRHGGQVFALQQQSMPSQAKIAAVYRY